jgi:hypothetical protein
MSSTDSDRQQKKRQKRLARFYRAHIQALTTEPADEPATGESYYHKRDWKPLTPEDFELAVDDEHSLGEALDAFWANTPLAGLGKRLPRLMRRLPTPEESSSELSHVYYEMF